MIALGSDHGGYDLKERVKAYLDKEGIAYKDYGCHSKESCDYPVFGKAAAEAVASGECDKGPLSAEMPRRHNDANMLAMGAGIVGPNLAERIVEVFLNTAFEGGRHARRVGLITEMEK